MANSLVLARIVVLCGHFFAPNMRGVCQDSGPLNRQRNQRAGTSYHQEPRLNVSDMFTSQQ